MDVVFSTGTGEEIVQQIKYVTSIREGGKGIFSKQCGSPEIDT
jgi:hypothetical protein